MADRRETRDAEFVCTCGRHESDHDICDECRHPDCDCICAFLRDVWPTHPANHEAASA
jgi:hypothetical protein